MGGAGAGGDSAHAGFDAALRVDWIGADQLSDGLPGRLGLTFLPGKRGVSTRYPGRVYARDLSADMASLREAGVRRLVLLVEDVELERWSDPRIREIGAEGGVDVVRYPIPDGDPPASLAEMQAILDDIRTGRADGDVAVACMGGVGRTGTVAACALIEAGLDSDAAIGTVRAVRHPGAVETARQERFVRSFEAATR
ncbi:MAG: cyclin-dependent kinase inhibitor 3 family protein [Gemmatimonadales bacterium]